MPSTRSIFIVLFLTVILIPDGSSVPAENNHIMIRTISPGQGAVLRDNSPLFCWSAQDSVDGYEVWVDDVCVAQTAGDRNRVIPFPLSFGSHSWYVAGIRGTDRIISPSARFFIEDAPAAKVPENARLLRCDWQMASSVRAGQDGRILSTQPALPDIWYKTSVPVTVLSALVRNGVYPNPYVGKNNMRIPDLDDAFNTEYNLLQYSHIPDLNPWKQPYWFRREFRMDECMRSPRIWLNLDEINYKADVWLNGLQIADTSTVKGMERRFRFDITDPVRFDTTNILLIAVYPPDHPGKPSPPPLEMTSHPGRNMGADGKISLDYTKWDALGWDWQPAIRDRDMGIIGDVYITEGGLTELQDVYISTDVTLADPVMADITVSFMLKNYAGTEKREIIRGRIKALGCADEPICFEFPVTLAPFESRDIILTPETIEPLHFENPRLWWPVHRGKQDLYEIRLTYEDESTNHQIRDVFGIRKVETYIGNNERVYRINGQDMYMKAGNWVLDAMLNWTPDRYVQEVALAANANMNLLRVWGPTGVPPDIFFRAADSLGVMVWQDFLNDFWGTFNNNPALKPDSVLFQKCTSDVVRRLRNHACVVIWCGGNEGPNQYETMIMNEILPGLDPSGGRHYLKNSLADGIHGSGPYHTIRPAAYFEHENMSGFNSEIGPSGVPVEISLYEFLPELGKTWYKGQFPLYADWGYHDANERGKWDKRKFSYYDGIVRNDYGPPVSEDAAGVSDYALKCQLVNYDVYRAAIEAINQDLWKASSGFALWKVNAGWPSLTWQLYDWYQYANAGYYSAKKACEVLHGQINRDSLTVSVINSGPEIYKNVSLQVEARNLDSERIWRKKEKIDISPNQARESVWTVKLTEDTTLCFVRVMLKKGRHLLSENCYWMHPGNDFHGLFNMEPVRLKTKTKIHEVEDQYVIDIEMKNRDAATAFFVHLRILDGKSGEEVRPVFWTDNYITFFPKEKRKLSVRVARELFAGKPVLSWEGVNVTAVQQICSD